MRARRRDGRGRRGVRRRPARRRDRQRCRRVEGQRDRARSRAALPDATIVPGHPVAGTEHSGPEAGFATLFRGRWCILTPEEATPEAPVARLRAFWEALGAKVEIMTPRHHDLVLAVTSHVPHLIAYSIVGTASDLEEVTQREVIKYSAGGFRDFTRIAASDPTMWRDVFLTNREAVLEILQRLTEDVTMLQRAIRWGEGDQLFDLFTRTRAIRRSIIEQGQDDAAARFRAARTTDDGCGRSPLQRVDRGMDPRVDLLARQPRRDRLAERGT